LMKKVFPVLLVQAHLLEGEPSKKYKIQSQRADGRYFPRGKDPDGPAGSGEIGGRGEAAGSGAVRSGAMARLDGRVPPGSARLPAGGAGRDPAGVPDV